MPVPKVKGFKCNSSIRSYKKIHIYKYADKKLCALFANIFNTV